MARRKDVYVSRSVGRYRVGMWLPLKNLLGLGFLAWLGLAIFGLFSVQSRIDNDKEFESFKPVTVVAKWTCTEDREKMPEGLKRYGQRMCWSTERNGRGDIRYSAVGETPSIIKAKP